MMDNSIIHDKTFFTNSIIEHAYITTMAQIYQPTVEETSQVHTCENVVLSESIIHVCIQKEQR